jgi:methyl-accepting chemotaxis protein
MHSMLGEIISKEFTTSFERTVTHIGNLAETTKPVMENLIKLIEQRSIGDVSAPGAAERGITANVSTAVERIDRLVANINEVLGDEHVQEDLRLAVRELKSSSEELKLTVQTWRTESQRLSDNLNAGIDRTEEHLDRSFSELHQVLDNIDSSTKSLASIADGVARGQGTIGLLTRDPRLYEAAVLAMERLAEVVSDVKVITGKIKEEGYITVGQAPSGLLKKNFPVGPEAPEKNR